MKAFAAAKELAKEQAKELASAGAAKATEAAKAGAAKAQEMGARAAEAIDTAFTEIYEDLPDDALGPRLLATDVFKGSELMHMHSMCDASYGSRWEGDQEIEGCASVPPWEEIAYNAKHNLRVIGAVCDDRRVDISYC